MAKSKQPKKTKKTEKPDQETYQEAYQVLARKYRPKTFTDLIGQAHLVRTLSNAIENDRLAHAYILTGVRGIGKTSTARIIAKALNAKGKDGKGPPTLDPDPKDENAIAIEEGHHVDVLEMDAASRTGVGDIRELIDNVQYKPVMAKYKVYIIDEVHMLSTQAFNALLKTLEEPPEHVIFIFATTEIRKLPITVLSRCQRFDLRRVEMAELCDHLTKITKLEDGKITQEAALALARAADGSVRDGLSLLDQALVVSDKDVTLEVVQGMLGLVDKSQTYDLLDACFAGDAGKALETLEALYKNGADPLMVMQDLLDLTHWLTRLKVAPEAAKQTGSEIDLTRGNEMIANLSMAVLGRAWQLLLKAVQEVQFAPRPIAAAEMVLVRFCYMADLPTPDQVIAQHGTGAPVAQPAANQSATPNPNPKGGMYAAPTGGASGGGTQTNLAVQPQAVPESTPQALHINSFEQMLQVFHDQRKAVLLHHLEHDVHLVKFEQGRIELRLGQDAPQNLPSHLGKLLNDWTGQRWIITVSNAAGAETIAVKKQKAQAALEEKMRQEPMVAKVLEYFPEAQITNIQPRTSTDEGETQ